jgi:hypothetical protein
MKRNVFGVALMTVIAAGVNGCALQGSLEDAESRNAERLERQQAAQDILEWSGSFCRKMEREGKMAFLECHDKVTDTAFALLQSSSL